MADLSKEMLEKKLAELTKEDDKPKKPENLFSKPIDVTQSEEAQKKRLKTAIIEGLIFAAFLTSITLIYSLSGLEYKLDPTGEPANPSFVFFLFEFVFFGFLVSFFNYKLTEKRVDDYNQKMASLSFDIEEEIAQALELQAEEGITAEEAMALNKSNGEEDKTVLEVPVEIKATGTSESLTDKAFEAFMDGEKVGSIACCKAFILDSMGIEQTIVRIFEFEKNPEVAANNVSKELFGAVKDAVLNDGFPAIVTSKEINNEFCLGFYAPSKYNITASDEDTVICEAYPGALMGISGELK